MARQKVSQSSAGSKSSVTEQAGPLQSEEVLSESSQLASSKEGGVENSEHEDKEFNVRVSLPKYRSMFSRRGHIEDSCDTSFRGNRQAHVGIEGQRFPYNGH